MASELITTDYDSIKNDLEKYAKEIGYSDVEEIGSNINLLINFIAYRSTLDAFTLSENIKETFLDTATKRENVIKKALEYGYIAKRALSYHYAIRLKTNEFGVFILNKYTNFKTSDNNYIYMGDDLEFNSNIQSKLTLPTRNKDLVAIDDITTNLLLKDNYNINYKVTSVDEVMRYVSLEPLHSKEDFSKLDAIKPKRKIKIIDKVNPYTNGYRNFITIGEISDYKKDKNLNYLDFLISSDLTKDSIEISNIETLSLNDKRLTTSKLINKISSIKGVNAPYYEYEYVDFIDNTINIKITETILLHLYNLNEINKINNDILLSAYLLDESYMYHNNKYFNLTITETNGSIFTKNEDSLVLEGDNYIVPRLTKYVVEDETISSDLLIVDYQIKYLYKIEVTDTNGVTSLTTDYTFIDNQITLTNYDNSLMSAKIYYTAFVDDITSIKVECKSTPILEDMVVEYTYLENIDLMNEKIFISDFEGTSIENETPYSIDNPNGFDGFGVESFNENVSVIRINYNSPYNEQLIGDIFDTNIENRFFFDNDFKYLESEINAYSDNFIIEVKEGVMSKYIDANNQVIEVDDEIINEKKILIYNDSIEENGIELFVTHFDKNSLIIENDKFTKRDSLNVGVLEEKSFCSKFNSDYNDYIEVFTEYAYNGIELTKGMILKFNLLKTKGSNGYNNNELMSYEGNDFEVIPYSSDVNSLLTKSGSDVEELNDIKLNAKLIYSIDNSIVSKNDYINFSLTKPYIKEVNVWGGEECSKYSYNRCQETIGNVYLSIIPSKKKFIYDMSDYGYNLTTLKSIDIPIEQVNGTTDSLFSDISKKSVITIEHNFRPLTFVYLDLSIDLLNYRFGVSLSETKEIVKDNVVEFFSNNITKLETPLYKSSVIKNIDSNIGDNYGFNYGFNYYFKIDRDSLYKIDESYMEFIYTLSFMKSKEFIKNDAIDVNKIPSFEENNYIKDGDKLFIDYNSVVGFIDKDCLIKNEDAPLHIKNDTIVFDVVYFDGVDNNIVGEYIISSRLDYINLNIYVSEIQSSNTLLFSDIENKEIPITLLNDNVEPNRNTLVVLNKLKYI